MDQPSASPRFSPPRAHARPVAPVARGCDPIGARVSPCWRVGVASRALRWRATPDFSMFCVGAPPRHCELRRWRVVGAWAGVGGAARGASPPRARFGVTGPALFAKGAVAGRGRDAPGLPSETVGEGNMPFLMPGLDGEKLFTGRAVARFGSACSFRGSRPVDLSPSDFVPRAPQTGMRVLSRPFRGPRGLRRGHEVE